MLGVRPPRLRQPPAPRSSTHETQETHPVFIPSNLRPGLGGLLVASSLFAVTAEAAALKVMPMGLGYGHGHRFWDITCTSTGGDCDEAYLATATVTLTAAPTGGSTFGGWNTDADADPCPPRTAPGVALTCTLTMGVARSVKPVFHLTAGTINPLVAADPSAITPEEIAAYLSNPANAATNTVARFISALPAQYRQSAILMSRSESLQTGTAEHPRILLSSSNARSVFSIGPVPHASYPGSHPDVIEYMQWDEATRNFRFHEIILTSIPAMGTIPPRSRQHREGRREVLELPLDPERAQQDRHPGHGRHSGGCHQDEEQAQLGPV